MSELLLVVATVALVPTTLWLISAHRSARRLRLRVVALHAAADARHARLSQELDDDIGQKLLSLKMHLQLSELVGPPSPVHDATVALLNSVIGDVRSLSHALRPTTFDEGPLIPALPAFARPERTRAEFVTANL